MWWGEDALMASDGGGRRRPWQLRGHPRVKREDIGGTSIGRGAGGFASAWQMTRNWSSCDEECRDSCAQTGRRPACIKGELRDGGYAGMGERAGCVGGGFC